MAQWDTGLRNAWVALVESTIGTAPIMKIRTGAPPADCATADSGTVLATLTLPSDWLSAPSAGVGSKVGTWADTSADASGTMGHFRVYDSGGTTCYLQGTVATSGADMTVNRAAIVASASFTVTGFTATAVGA